MSSSLHRDIKINFPHNLFIATEFGPWPRGRECEADGGSGRARAPCPPTNIITYNKLQLSLYNSPVKRGQGKYGLEP